MDSVTCSAWSLVRQLLEISMKDLEQEGEMGSLEDHSLSSLNQHRAELQTSFPGEMVSSLQVLSLWALT